MRFLTRIGLLLLLALVPAAVLASPRDPQAPRTAPTVSSAVLQDDGRYLVTLSDGGTFYAPFSVLGQQLPTALGAHGGLVVEGVASGTTIPVSLAAPASAAGADGSTTITLGATAQNLFSSATPTNGYEVCNPDANEDLWLSDSTTAAANAAGSARVAANGGCYRSPGGMKPFHAVSIIGATTGHKITARSW